MSKKANRRTVTKRCGCIRWQRRDALGKWYTKRAFTPASCTRHSVFQRAGINDSKVRTCA